MSDSNRDIDVALINAAKRGDTNEVKRLISEGADVDAYDGSQGNTLYWAVKNDHSDIAKVLLDNGANFIAYDSSRERHVLNKYKEVEAEHCKVSLHLAARLGDLKAVKDLLKKEANVNAQNDKGQTPFDLAVDEEIKDLLQSIKEANDKLFKAAKSGNIDDVENLLNKEEKAQVNAENEFEETPLHLAAQNGHKDVVEFLFSKGAKVDAKSDGLSTPLHFAAKSRYKDTEKIVKFLLDKGADVNAQNDAGETPLHLILKKADLDIDRDKFYTLLDKKGINVNLTDENKDTPLHLFLKKEAMEIRELGHLLRVESINVNLQNIDRKTPLHLVIEKSNWNTLPHVSWSREMMVDILIEMEAIVDAVDKYERTPLHWAAVYGRKEIVEALINAEAIVDAVDKYERTPLHWAAVYGRKEIVEALINAEANVGAQDKYGKTPFNLTTDEEIKTLLKAAENPGDGSVDKPSTDNEENSEEDAGTREKEKQEGDAQSGSDITKQEADKTVNSGSGTPQTQQGGQPTTSAGQGTDVQDNVVNPVASTQTEEQASSFFGSLFSILMKPFSLVASFFGSFFSWLFGSDEPTQSSSESEQPVDDSQYDSHSSPD
ncbi:ankyrin repeat domain-containing protein [Wolbachia endosymbiont (group A) of Beris morrisii]|uniref:ankyrin repeat domain-containing protein n=1 Tax=Wolbachia endosymbiont (group A) of Beris morrisii TaxID=3066139 RepID=UPI0033404F81